MRGASRRNEEAARCPHARKRAGTRRDFYLVFFLFFLFCFVLVLFFVSFRRSHFFPRSPLQSATGSDFPGTVDEPPKAGAFYINMHVDVAGRSPRPATLTEKRGSVRERRRGGGYRRCNVVCTARIIIPENGRGAQR